MWQNQLLAKPYEHQIYKVSILILYMHLWKLVAFVILVAAIGHLIFLFQEAEPSEATPLEEEPMRHIVWETNFLPILCDILIVVIIISGLKGLKRRKKPKVPEDEYNWLAMMAIRIGALVVIALLYYVFIRSRVEGGEFGSVFAAFRRFAGPGAQSSGFILAEPTAFEQFVAIVLSLIVIALIIMFIVLMFKPAKPEEEEPVLLAAFPEFFIKRGEFTFDGNPRDVVINAYGAALHDLYQRGIKIPDHFTPWEFQQQVKSSHLNELTQLFEKARYSTHDISLKDSQEAVKQFKLIQKEEIDGAAQPAADSDTDTEHGEPASDNA